MTDLITPTRRTVVRSAAWTVPAVAASTAAPAFAASPCGTSYAWRVDWGAAGTSYTRGATVAGVQTGTATVTGSTGTAPMIVTFSSAMTGTMQRDADNLRLSTDLTQTATVANVGATGGPGLNISHAAAIPSGSANAQELSISFSRAVSGLAFTITDIDISNGDWSDRVELTGTRTGTATGVTGSGTSADPWRATNAGNAGNGSNTRNLDVVYSGSIAANTPIVLRFWNASGNGNQRIFISDLTFTALGC